MEQIGGYSRKLFKDEHCSPSSQNGISCLDDKLILKVAKVINKITKNDTKYTQVDLNKPINKIHDEICKILHKMSGCSSESCWMNIKKLMKHMGKDKEKFKEKFKPVMPNDWVDNYNVWLKTDDIEKCLDQYEDKHDDFYFYGAVPIDFAKCAVSNLCSFNLKKHLSNNQSKIGIVFNTDPHDEPGEHWISLYIDAHGVNMNKIPGIYYFDSYGEKPTKEIEKLVTKIKRQGKGLNIDFKYLYNDHQFQKKNYQCGMYSIFFINEMLKNKSFKRFLNLGLTDDKMKEKRDKFFISPEEIKCKYTL